MVIREGLAGVPFEGTIERNPPQPTLIIQLKHFRRGEVIVIRITII